MLMRKTARYFIGVSSLRAPQTRTTDQLPQSGAPFFKCGAESDDEEEQVVSC
jgi:hypothetical protein